MKPPDLRPDDELPVLLLTRRARQRLLGAALTLVGLLALPYVIPPLSAIRPWHPDGGYTPFWNITARPSMQQQEREQEQLADFERIAVSAEVPEAPGAARAAGTRPVASAETPRHPSGTGRRGQTPTPSRAVRVFPAYAGHPDDDARVETPIENVEGLAHYFGRLTLTDMKVPGAITRAGHWGDSVLGGDGLTHALRKRLQARFGDSGHGFHALSRYSIGYLHRGVRFQDRGGWKSCEIIFNCRPDDRYGYAGVHSSSTNGGQSLWQTAKEGPGDKVSRFELWYSKARDGGRFELKIDGELAKVIDTRGDAASDEVEAFDLADGPHSFELRAAGGGAARGYGVVLERDVPGVVWDELSLIGSFTQRLDYQDAEHLGWQLRRRGIDLMVFIFGGNDVQRESDDLKSEMRPYEEEYSRVLRKFRRGRPEASCLVMSLIDHGVRSEGTVRTRPIVPRLVAAQRKVAKAQGCAFFDTFQAMGGPNSIARWLRARPQLAAPDYSHPTLAGQGVIATLLYRALMRAYANYRLQNAGASLPEVAGSSAGAAGGDRGPGSAGRGATGYRTPVSLIAADAGAPEPR
jgi:lysophospholipase L1-like esterase